jgi:hypothetical protein
VVHIIAQVNIDNDGDVSVSVDSDQDDGELSSLALDSLLAQAAAIALETWWGINGTDAEPETTEAAK